MGSNQGINKGQGEISTTSTAFKANKTINISTISMEAPDQAQSFAMKLVEILNNGALCLMISIGHRTGLFDTLAPFYPEYVSSQTLAQKANLNERYVREWLGAMVVGKIIEYDSESKSYRLPKEHAACITREAGPGNMAVFVQYISILGSVEDGIFKCFKNGGGLPYEAFPRFQEVMAEDSYQSTGSALHSVILPGIPGLLDRLEKGCKLLDVGCGRGRIILNLANHFPNSTFRGYDISVESMAIANAEANSSGLANISFHVKDVSKIEEADEYDVITAFDAIHDQVDPVGVLKQINRALKNDGMFVMQDINTSSDLEKNVSHPLGPLLYTISTMHCMTVSLAHNGMGLGTCWGRELALKMLKENGFNKTDIVEFPHDVQNCWYINRKQE
ncbi:930_t:CDS:1 [Paraglomus brasilianum]|uniref:930_t:CDS:1 n=1 Tax=Paraglomus brasilianum TaxID=144538 RepID=A0A9N9FQ50_9GLOM|nr:930_t:CDS:1 [Paraglomus brasilianum]